MKLISVVVPCYNEEESIILFYKEIKKISETLNYNFEYIFVDDGSSDDTLKILQDLHEIDKDVNYVSFTRNFGKESAIYAGFEHCSGDFVALMDADLQDPPSLLSKMIEILEKQEYDNVATRRVTRDGEPKIRSFFARQFYKIINKISDIEFVDGARDYRVMSKQMVDSILKMKEKNRFTKGIFSWIGYKTFWLEYKNIERISGQTKWSFWKLFLYSLEGIAAFSTLPLMISSFIGIVLCVLSFFMMVFVMIRALLWSDPVAGWPSLVCIILFIGGIQLFCMGILGQYISKTYIESKNRPIYIKKYSTLKENKNHDRI